MKIGAGYWFRAAIMAIGLVVVLFIMRKLNKPHSLDSTMIGAGVTAAAVCPTRILWVETAQGALHIEEEGTKWIRLLNGQQKQLDTIAVEKWFSKFCSVDTEETGAGETEEKQIPLLKIGYVSHKRTEVLSKNADGVYLLRGQRFNSKDMNDLLTALPLLPLEKAPGTVTETPASH